MAAHVFTRRPSEALIEAAHQAGAGHCNYVFIPHVGDHVRITGPLVRDLVHDAEFPNLEVHPAVTIVELGS